MTHPRMHEEFVALCETPSPTGAEAPVAELVRRSLSDAGLETVNDDGSGRRARSDTDNFIARAGDPAVTPVAFIAHLDTVPHPAPIEVELADGVYRSRTETILGADNKAAVAVLLELGRVLAAGDAGGAAELVFTVAEEDGLRGAKALDVGLLSSSAGFVMDLARDIGQVAVQAPTYVRVEAEFTGTEAHAGLRPESGASAIEAACRAVAAMELGRVDEETTANVGVIAGGSAPNVVAGRCSLDAESRSRVHERAHAGAQAMLDACMAEASALGCDVEVELTELFRGYTVSADSLALGMAKDALTGCGHQFSEVVTGGGSDANALRAAGFDAVLLANGTRDNHTPEESVAASRIDEMLAVCLALCAGG